ncbi:hypothetical protein QCW_0256 [Clostridioides difficile CD69]|nr:hypothetical protein QCW_0256 [Clostridioides difficile CD69]
MWCSGCRFSFPQSVSPPFSVMLLLGSYAPQAPSGLPP